MAIDGAVAEPTVGADLADDSQCPGCGAMVTALATGECPDCGAYMPGTRAAEEPSTLRSQLLRGVPERRGFTECELRAKNNGLLHFTGYAAVFDQPYEVTDRFG